MSRPFLIGDDGTHRLGHWLRDHELQRDRSMMRRTTIAAVWVFGATVPLLTAVVFLFGCCVLPFHASLHKAVPLCHLAIDFISGEHRDGAQQPMPAREKQEPVKRIATEVPRAFLLDGTKTAERHVVPIDTTAFRSFITLGAIRCDQDVGLHLLVGTFLI
jgi:hypothetical protein